ncbi:MAG: ATP synthase F1 subunit epsilon [Phycisphaerales bacterium]|nr:ATP synthase F1 subunit epsilon [Phycisphaerae bacterium]NNF42544.1 ATP synthase F1 subunit epsilon [Phycisphaerales bacterium]NNM25086.1 ATP synthase F1 subunit epsilon [Phycisphaerales bacterium]
MSKTFRCTVVTPARAVFDDAVSYATFPAWDGQQGVLPGQSPILSRLGIGPMRVDADGGSQWWLVEGGFAQIRDDVLMILTERATPVDELSAAEAEEALVDANERARSGGVDRQVVEADQQRARARKAMALAHGGNPGH